jgi:hypothetical protein
MDKTTMSALWEKHLDYELTTRDTEATLATMVEDAYVNHVPVLTGGVGKEQLPRVLRPPFDSAVGGHSRLKCLPPLLSLRRRTVARGKGGAGPLGSLGKM